MILRLLSDACWISIEWFFASFNFNYIAADAVKDVHFMGSVFCLQFTDQIGRLCDVSVPSETALRAWPSGILRLTRRDDVSTRLRVVP